MKKKRLDSQASVIEVSKTDTSSSPTNAFQRIQTFLKRRKRCADDITPGDDLPSSSKTSNDQENQSTVHKENVADRAVQRKELEDNRGIGDQSKVERMQKRSLDKEKQEEVTQQGAKRQRLMQRTSEKKCH